MFRHKPLKHLPVTRRELAVYLGISPSLLSMSESGSLRSMPSALSVKLTELAASHERSKRGRKPKRSMARVSPLVNKEAKNLAEKMKLDAEHYSMKALVLKRKLENMIRSYKEDEQWLKTVEERLAVFTAAGALKADHRWFKNQEMVVKERMERSGIIEQVKLEMQVELAKSKAGINRSLLKKLKK